MLFTDGATAPLLNICRKQTGVLPVFADASSAQPGSREGKQRVAILDQALDSLVI
jgi:hypothetical protein